MVNQNPLLDVTSISFKTDDKAILKKIRFSVLRKEMLGIIGPNGAGKTSLLRCIAGLNQQYDGDIIFDGQNIKDFERKALARRVATVAQLSLPIFSLSVLDVVRMGLIPHKSIFATDSSKDRETIEHALEKVGLAQFRYKQFGILSGGEQQRALIARALVQGAELLLMDEPTNHLDVYYQHQIMQLVKALDVTVLTTVHDLNLAAQYCERLLLIENGSLVADGTPDDVLQPQRLSDVFGLTCARDTDPHNGLPRVSFHLEQR